MTSGRRLVSPQNTAFYRLRLGAAALSLLAVISAAMALNAAYDGVPEVVAHRVSLHPDNSLIAQVQITLSDTAQVFVEYDNPEAGKFVTALSEPGTEHHIPVVRLRPETAYAYTIGLQAGNGGRAYGPAGEFTTGPLPPELAGRQSRAAGRSTQPLITVDWKDGHNTWYFLWDETGRIVWYHKAQGAGRLQEASWGGFSIRQQPNGNLVYIRGGCCLVEITPLGEVVDWLEADADTGWPRHDFLLLDDGRILYLNYEKVAASTLVRGWDADTAVRVEGLRSWNQTEGASEEVWQYHDTFAPGPESVELNSRNWPRFNSLSVGAGGNWLLSARNRNQLIALSPDFRRIQWRLGGPDSDYEFPDPADRFYEQHTASQLPNGNILLFDNGSGRPAAEGGDYSRALELRLDAANGTAVKAWEYRHRPDLFASWVSSAFRLGNGHTLVNFGVNGDVTQELTPLVVVEVNRAGDEVFRVETFSADAADWSYPRRYRAAAGLTSLMGETMLRPPSAPPGPAQRPADGWWRQPVRDPAAFSPHLDGRRLVYRKAPCAPGEIADTFLLHLYPVNPGDLPEERREYGYENRDFRFGQWGTIRDGQCLASVPLPEYPIARIHTGQYIPGGERLWEVELPGPAMAPAQ